MTADYYGRFQPPRPAERADSLIRANVTPAAMAGFGRRVSSAACHKLGRSLQRISNQSAVTEQLPVRSG